MLRDKKIKQFLRKAPGTAVPKGLLERLNANIALTKDQRRKTEASSVLARMSRNALPKLAAAAVILLAVWVGARMLVAPEKPSGREPTVLAESAGENETDLAMRTGPRARTADLRQIVADPDLQLEKVEQMYAANDIDGLVTMLSQASPASQVAAANYLAQMDAGTEAFETLEKVNAAYIEHNAGADNPFEPAIKRMRNRINSATRPANEQLVAKATSTAGLHVDVFSERTGEISTVSAIRGRRIESSDAMYRGQQESEILRNLPLSVPSVAVDVRIEAVKARGRVYVAQLPSQDNDYKLIITFDDGTPGGADWYETVLHIGSPGGWPIRQFSITVKAYIDGVSNLVFKDNTVCWHHLEDAAPGRHEGHNHPTYIGDIEWIPEWPQPARTAETTADYGSSRPQEIADGRPVRSVGTWVAWPANWYQNLVLYYSFQTTQEPDTVMDVSGRACHGKLHGATYVQDEVLGGAMLFDGQDDYITIPDIYLEAFTFSAWIKPATGGINNRRIFMLYEEEHCYAIEGNSEGGISVCAEKWQPPEPPPTDAPDDALVEQSAGQPLPTDDFTEQSRSEQPSSPIIAETEQEPSSENTFAGSDWAGGAQFSEYHWRVKAETWTHITVTYDGTTGAIYRNGQLTEEGRIPAEGFTGTAYIGGIEPHNGGFWQGAIDEAALFNRALTAQEVEQLFLMTGEPVELPEPTDQSEPRARTEPIEASGLVKTTGLIEATHNSHTSAEPMENPATATVDNELIEVAGTLSTKHPIAAGFYWWGPCAADIDGDGDLDVLAAAHPDNIAGPFSSRTRELSSGLSEISSVADVSGENEEVSDEDKEQQAPCGLCWWQSTDDYGTTWSEHVIDANFRALMPPYPADMDGDGDVDVITCEYDTSRIVWWENTHRNGSSWKKHVLDEETDGRQLVYGADMDGDRDIDVAGATWLDGGVFWWENTNGRGTDWNKHIVDSNTEADYCRTHCLRVADMDGDRYLDIVASAGTESGINWWQNPGRGAEDWKRHYVVGSDGEVESVYPADLDGDGDADLIGSIRRHDGLTWWENIDRAGTDWTKHVIDSSYTGEQGVDVADIDRDGDLDITASAQRTHSVIWWENTTGTATEWARHVMTKSFSDAFGAYGVDMDGDGDLDLLGAAHSGKEIAWFENQPVR